MTDPAFTAEVYHNEYLPDGGRVVDAVITVAATGGDAVAATARPTAAQIIMVDTSGSMGHPSTKISAAKKATAAAIDTLPDGVPFAVISGSDLAELVFPGPGDMRLVRASEHSRGKAKAAVARLHPEGGTAIGRWLDLANRLFGRHEAAVKHAILLTDGRNEHETPEQLRKTLDACTGNFVCDARGVGEGWVAQELRMVASTLLGTADGLEDLAELPAAFREMTERAMGKAVANVALRLWTPAGAAVRYLKQVFPEVEDLTARRIQVTPRIGEYPTGAWGAESRDYHLSVEVEPGGLGEERLVARVSLTADGAVLIEQLVPVRWTDDTALATRISPQVAHYTGQAELAEVIQEGLAARDAGDVDVATAKLGRAVQLASESGHEDTAKLLARVVDVVDEATGTVRLRKQVAGVHAEIANVRSVKTVRVKKKSG